MDLCDVLKKGLASGICVGITEQTIWLSNTALDIFLQEVFLEMQLTKNNKEYVIYCTSSTSLIYKNITFTTGQYMVLTYEVDKKGKRNYECLFFIRIFSAHKMTLYCANIIYFLFKYNYTKSIISQDIQVRV